MRRRHDASAHRCPTDVDVDDFVSITTRTETRGSEAVITRTTTMIRKGGDRVTATVLEGTQGWSEHDVRVDGAPPPSAKLAVLFALLTLGTGCAGARTTVVAESASYPVSLSRAVRDARGDLVVRDRVVKFGTFGREAMVRGLLYSAIRFNPRTDISEAAHAHVAAARTVRASSAAMSPASS